MVVTARLCAFASIVAVLALMCVEAATHRGPGEPIPVDLCGATVSLSDDDRLYVFALSEDNVVWHKFELPHGGWSKWLPVADKRHMSSGPRVVRYVNGTMQVFARGTDRKFYVTSLSSGDEWSVWQSPFPEREFASQPVPVMGSGDSVLVFGIDASTHTVCYSESSPLTAGNELAYSAWRDLGGEATSPPSVMVDAEGLTHVFIRGTNRGLWHLAEHFPRLEQADAETDKSWGDWECLGGVLASYPRIPTSLNGANLVEVFARAHDKALWYRRMVSDQTAQIVEWDTWHTLGGVLSSGPAVSLNDDGTIDVFARATDKALYFKSQFEDENGETHFTQWQTLGGLFTTTPSVVARADGTLDLFARGVDKGIWHSHQIDTNGTLTFSPWHFLGGYTRKYTC